MLAVLAAAGFAVGFATTGAAGPQKLDATSRVAVVASEFKFRFSKRSVPTGTVIFTVVNKGKISHNFKIAGKTTKTLKPGKSTTLRVRFSKKGHYAYSCTLAGHAAAGMKGVFSVGTTPVKTTPTTTTTPTGTVGTAKTTINVGMYEYRFDLSQTTVPSGQVTFVITNKGSEVHNFDISGVKSGALLGPGQSETWTVGLPPKTYTYVCDVPFHIDRGMTGALAVT